MAILIKSHLKNNAIFMFKRAVFLCVLLSFFSHGQPAPKVKLGAIDRAPFFFSETGTGLGVDLVNVLNQIQSDYRFMHVAIPTKRRTQALEFGWVDGMLWDNPAWGWQADKINTSLPLFSAKDVFVTLKGDDTTQDYFNDLTGKRIGAVRGYYYNFLKEAGAENRYDLVNVATEDQTLSLLVQKRVAVAVTSTSSIQWFLSQQPQYQDALYISERVDGAYERYVLLSNSAPIEIAQIDRYLLRAHQEGLIAPIYAKYGLTVPTSLAQPR